LRLGLKFFELYDKISVVIVDFDLDKKYPQNFVCKLPYEIHEGKNKGDNSFPNRFKNLTKEQQEGLIRQLLLDAKKIETDPIFRQEIERRLKRLKNG